MRILRTAALLILWTALAATELTAEPPAAPAAPGRGQVPGPNCADGVVKDDGSAETGWGWVPSVIEGQYVQEFRSGEFVSRRIATVCACWMRAPNGAADLAFDVVFYEEVENEDGDLVPAFEPYAAIPAMATDIPDTDQQVRGRFYEIDVGSVTLRPGRNFIGVRWDAMTYPRDFVCADISPETPPVEVFFIDDRADAWTSVFETIDPIFEVHRAILVRAVADPTTPTEVPGLGIAGLIVLALGVAGAAWWRLR